MTPKEFRTLLNSWTLDRGLGVEVGRVNGLLECLEDHLYNEYEPTQNPHPGFWSRLGDWLGNVAVEADQHLMFLMLEYLLFVGIRDFHSLHRLAYSATTARWIVDQAGIDLFENDSEENIRAEFGKTWFCPITDSARINTFYHVNGIAGVNRRPPFDDLQEFGDPSKIDQGMTSHGFERLVLLEDFVGTGLQMKPAVEFAVGLRSNRLPVLLCPMLICPPGHKVASALEKTYPNLVYEPVYVFDEKLFISPQKLAGEPELFARCRRLVELIHPQVMGADVGSPFGFGETGALTVLYSNCPDNTLPVIHHTSASWKPLFPRASRL